MTTHNQRQSTNEMAPFSPTIAVYLLVVIYTLPGLVVAVKPVASSTLVDDYAVVKSSDDSVFVDWIDEHDATSSSNRKLQQVDSCLDTLDWFSSRNSQMLRENYNCSCSGDYASYFTFNCSIYDYCFVDERNTDNTTTAEGDQQRCVNSELFFEFSTDSNRTIETVWKSGYCVDYLVGGPAQEKRGGRLCKVEPNACALLLKDYHSFSTEEATDTCGDAVVCRDVVSNLNNYTTEQVEKLCGVSTQLGGIECNTIGGEFCSDRIDDIFFVATPDCSNVDPCATTFCQEKWRFDVVPERFFPFYPECLGTTDSSSTSAPTSTPTSPLVPMDETLAPIGADKSACVRRSIHAVMGTLVSAAMLSACIAM